MSLFDQAKNILSASHEVLNSPRGADHRNRGIGSNDQGPRVIREPRGAALGEE